MASCVYGFMAGFMAWMAVVWLAGGSVPIERGGWALIYCLVGLYTGGMTAVIIHFYTKKGEN